MKYLLRTDCAGKTNSMIWSKKSFVAFQGDLFEELPQDKQPTDESKIAVASVEDKAKIIEVETAALVELSQAECDLLLPLQTGKERFDMCSVKHNQLKQAVAAKIGDKVSVITDTSSSKRKGTIKYKDKLDGKKGTYFGVALDVSRWPTVLAHTVVPHLVPDMRCYRSTSTGEIIKHRAVANPSASPEVDTIFPKKAPKQLRSWAFQIGNFVLRTTNLCHQLTNDYMLVASQFC